MKGNSDLDPNGNNECRKRSPQVDCILKVETQKSANRVECEYKRKKGDKEDAQVLGLNNERIELSFIACNREELGLE